MDSSSSSAYWIPVQVSEPSSTSSSSSSVVAIDPSNLGTWKDLVFKDYDALYNFYSDYALKHGFAVRKRYASVRRGYPKDLQYYIKIVCYKEGVKEPSKNIDVPGFHPKLEIRNSCNNAYLKADYDVSLGIYKIKEWKDEHNHDLIEADHVHLLSKNRHIDEAQAVLINNSLNCGLSIRSTYETMSVAAGGRENLHFTKIDLKNWIYTKRQKEMLPGEGTVLCSWLREQQRLKPGFYYDIQVDAEEAISSIFWADPRMISDYKLFGDFVSFDTTFRTNNLHRPLGIFVGFNHHYGTCVFGAALLFDETGDSFKWLFQSFLKCMGGKHPVTLITDQAAAIGLAASVVFPTTFHALCTFHICENARTNLKSLISEIFWEELHQLINYVDDEQQFEYSWNQMLVNAFNGRDRSEIAWLDSLYSTRKKWSSAWVMSHFTAGKTTTQLSEQFNAFGRYYLKPEYPILAFFTRFQALIDELRYNEMMKDFSMINTYPPNKHDKSALMLHAVKAYTPKIFEVLHQEFDCGQLFTCKQRIDLKHGSVHVFDLCRLEDLLDRNSAIVEEERVEIDYDTLSISCTCHFMDRWWIPCRHILRAMDCLYAFGHQFCDRIPEQYINKRWCRNCKVDVPLVDKKYAISSSSSSYGDRYQSFFNIMVGIGTRLCSDENAYKFFLEKVLAAAKEADDILHSAAKLATVPSRANCSTVSNSDCDLGEADDLQIFDPEPTDNVLPTGKTIKKKINPIISNSRLKRGYEIWHHKTKVRRRKECQAITTDQSTPRGIIDS